MNESFEYDFTRIWEQESGNYLTDRQTDKSETEHTHPLREKSGVRHIES